MRIETGLMVFTASAKSGRRFRAGRADCPGGEGVLGVAEAGKRDVDIGAINFEVGGQTDLNGGFWR